ncbi:hypothetical protein E0Z10_g9154 [Xylaria hypoxylon]|uniref:Uncharacterized protein n=1 Tax=Xylaria hypoxylon TaxID=37992 RepID=A0A4Z0Y763_9PEZI|nr:hypothetical protein E0Z10_g9154 [Xylaria hypoxylon]
MPQDRIPLMGSGVGAAKSAGKINSTSNGGVLSRVLGSFRRHSHSGGATADNKEDTDWATTYKITHRPDRPRRDKREGLKQRNSAYVLGQLHRIWRHSERMAEAKKRERAARESAFAAKFRHSQDQRNREDGGVEHDQSSSHPIPANEADKTKAHHGQSAFPPSPPLDSSDTMTIRVGLKLQSPYNKEGQGTFQMNSGGRPETGGYSNADGTSALSPTRLSAPRSFAPLTVPLRSAPPSISSGQKRVVRRRHTRTLSHSSMQRTAPVNTMQKPNARAKALRDTMTLYINTDQDSTPSLVLNSSPVSEQASPLTPIDDVHEDEYADRKISPTGPRTSNICPMPVCDNPLLTTADRKQNLCAECRSELQPRQSIFITDVLNPSSGPYPSTDAYASSCTSLISSTQDDSTAEVAEAKAENMPEMTCYINGEGKTRTSYRRSGNQSAGRVRTTDISPSSPNIIKINNSHILSRFNRDRGEFKLQPVSPSRKHSRRGRKPHLGNLPTRHQTGNQKPAGLPRGESHDENGSNHIGFQLAGWRTPTPSPTPQPSSRRPLNSTRREPSGPLLEPKTFAPVTLATRQSKDTSAVRHRQSDSRPGAKRGSATSNGGRASYLPRAHVEKIVEPTPKSAPPGSTRHSRSRHQPNPYHREYRASEPVGAGTKTQENEKNSNLKAEKKIVGDEDIYHEIDSIIDCYLKLPDTPELANEKRKVEAVASYYSTVPLDVEMKIKGFF